MSAIENVGRRGFMKGMMSAGALVLSVRFLPETLWAEGLPKDTKVDHAVLNPSVYLGINTDGTVFIIAHRSEMGTGIRTSLPLVLADELEADWKRVKLEQAIGDERYGDQNTDGSHSIRSFCDLFLKAGASARSMLTQAAAQKWGVPQTECVADFHTVVHRASGRKLGYGELAAAAAKLPVPKKEDLRFKPRSAWRYIGKGTSSYDLTELCTGKSQFGMDVHRDGMVYASIDHPPVLGGKIKTYDDADALKVKGVSQTVMIDTFTPPWGFQPLGGVAVIANKKRAGVQCRTELNKVVYEGANPRRRSPGLIKKDVE